MTIYKAEVRGQTGLFIKAFQYSTGEQAYWTFGDSKEMPESIMSNIEEVCEVAL